MQTCLRILIVALLAMAGLPGASAGDGAPTATERSACGCGDACACGPICPCAAPADPIPEQPDPTPVPTRSSEHWRPSGPVSCEPMTFGHSLPRSVGWSDADERPSHRDARNIRLAASVFLI